MNTTVSKEDYEFTITDVYYTNQLSEKKGTTQSNAKTTTRVRKSNSAAESVATSESNISADTATTDKK